MLKTVGNTSGYTIHCDHCVCLILSHVCGSGVTTLKGGVGWLVVFLQYLVHSLMHISKGEIKMH